jgi:type IV secretory pathway VirB10-like protein
MADAPRNTTDPTVTDRRVTPRGGMNKNAKTWVMLAGLGGLIAVMFLGQAKPEPRTVSPAEQALRTPDPSVIHDQELRIKAAEDRARNQAPPLPPLTIPDAPVERQGASSVTPAAAHDTLAEERKRRAEESLFASNLVDGTRAATARPATVTRGAVEARADHTPTLEETADAVIRASQRAGMAMPGVMPGPPPPPAPAPAGAPEHATTSTLTTPAIPANGPTHRIIEGAIIDGVLTNQLDGSSTAPVVVQVTNPIYSHARNHVLIPAGAKVLGQAKPVQNFGESRIAVDFHRLVFPDGSAVSLESAKGLNQTGDNGLTDQVNNHYVTTFTVAAVTGLVTGIGQAVGNVGLGGNNRTTVMAGGVADSTAQATTQTLSRLSNRLPTVTIRAGARVKVYLMSDIELPAYPAK